VPVEDCRFVLELFHGPTLAFKDFGARFLARAFGYLLARRGGRATILVATSGDTGSAVAQGFFRIPRVEVVVLYPRGKVSPFQEAQIATLGGNVTAVRVPGTFDDCQRLVKRAFLDARLADRHLSSANSINIGRLLPQAVYYFSAWLQVAEPGRRVVFSVPSGNLGNITAGVVAQRLGLPVARFVAACNANDVLPEYLRTSVLRARPSIATLSNAMDVGDPSNFDRLLALHGGNCDALRANVEGAVVTDEETRATLREVHKRTGYLLDPHTAVAYEAARRSAAFHASDGANDDPVSHVVLGTAHPAKFGRVVHEELGFVPPLPESYRDWETRPLRVHELADVEYEGFRGWLSRAPMTGG
jgi:threonine synthase